MARRHGLWRDTGGLSTVEYILILVIVAITGILLWQTFGSSVGSRVDQATQSVAGMDGRGAGAPGAVAAGDSAGAATAMAITEGRGEMASEGAGASAMGGGGSAGGEGSASAARARRAGEAEGAAAGFDEGDGGETADLPEEGPDLFLWIGWLLVLILGAATLFSVLGKRVGKGK